MTAEQHTAPTLQPPWCTSPDAAHVVGSFAEALGALEDIHRAQTAVIETKSGGSYRYSYANLADVLTRIRPTLAANGLGVSQHVSTSDGAVQVSTTLVHTSGEWITFAPLTLRVGASDPQSIGSGITYARRYALLALCGLATEDDDGAVASRTPPRSAIPTAIDWEALGWPDQAVHDAERERIRAMLGAVDGAVRDELLAKWADMGLSWPLSRDQLAEWEQVAAEITAQEQAAEPATTDDTSDPADSADADETTARPATGPNMTAPSALLAQVREAAAAAELDDRDACEYLSTMFGRPVDDLEALTVAQARAAVEMLQQAAAAATKATT